MVASSVRSLYGRGVTRPVDFLIDFLQAERARGRSHIFLNESAREGLRELFIRMRKSVVAPVLKAAPITQDAVVSGNGKSQQLAGLRKQAECWAPAMALGTLRETLVFATGNPDAEIMFVGDAPGYNEEKDCEPFVGPAGHKLNDILKAMGLRREDVYISNLVKFRPALPKQNTNNRKPSPEEMIAFLPLIMAEISVIRPKLIIALGSTAAEGLLGLEGAIDTMRGNWHEVSGVPTRATYHPNYLLQSGSSNGVKRALWEDMLAVMEKLEMPITEKQRGFFLPKK